MYFDISVLSQYPGPESLRKKKLHPKPGAGTALRRVRDVSLFGIGYGEFGGNSYSQNVNADSRKTNAGDLKANAGCQETNAGIRERLSCSRDVYRNHFLLIVGLVGSICFI